ncbi:guanylate kinase [Rickettsia prowazekii]|uniref:Guanylate kinase n=2 Tax=Rickettsia prowazekii TaxID=782 RepID=KGUA_RICPR|nr:guanylate kinase [Rickettsia prowazekii]Q9ZCH7.1 RecName: Full=Guanylate kinase; AltName: Full=GMP kinase [Rickettsia prowazekii str. Madrid E]ADE30328.1 Guanylate kinase [Rickettsia prowazekii str. Rp22]AFE49562.1 guanylate kinase [Rickettsia prowazekii str. Chernikova]AFE50406.1 guanylate kinase [Rickettsia prowazekii str. Katsinyian]AFE51250.1 guanylate kinase [Rickettsia prowazekii str. BuV67-CWPP]AFE52088.1 guanylate kinase [Rickettsia prowazekii str. Dachau]
MKFKNKGLIIILSSPSGTGKSSLAKELLKIDNNLRLSISVTTRKPRLGEVDGINYYFKSDREFKTLVKQNKFLEYAKIYNDYYGTPKEYVKMLLKQGFDVLFDIDWQGVRSIKKNTNNVITIFILPPSIEILEQRLRNRATDNEETIKLRMQSAQNEISHANEYDYVVINDDFSQTLKKIHEIIVAERAKNFAYHEY